MEDTKPRVFLRWEIFFAPFRGISKASISLFSMSDRLMGIPILYHLNSQLLQESVTCHHPGGIFPAPCSNFGTFLHCQPTACIFSYKSANGIISSEMRATLLSVAATDTVRRAFGNLREHVIVMHRVSV